MQTETKDSAEVGPARLSWASKHLLVATLVSSLARRGKVGGLKTPQKDKKVQDPFQKVGSNNNDNNMRYILTLSPP